jgi:hypothetical protein
MGTVDRSAPFVGGVGGRGQPTCVVISVTRIKKNVSKMYEKTENMGVNANGYVVYV